ncbi:MAG: NAD(P)H-dependent oxidoreductase subunit E [Anaerolineales bacterium]|nr:NAD(P)H-dependent oxidoreductase subunit E [Anaerolineales bacterium]
MTVVLEEAFRHVPASDPVADPARRAEMDAILEAHAGRPGAAMVVLNELQSRLGHVSPAMQAYVAQRLRVPVSAIHGVVTFYSYFTIRPRGKHTVKLCMGTACYVGGTPQLIDKAKQLLGISPGDTTADGALTLELCRCVGACSQAPVATVDDEVFGRLRPNKLQQLLRRYQPGGHAAPAKEE